MALGLENPKHSKPTQKGLDAADRAAPVPPTALSLTGPWLPLAHREEALVLRRGWLQPPILRLRVLHLFDACAQQLVLQQRRVGQAICRVGQEVVGCALGRASGRRGGQGYG